MKKLILAFAVTTLTAATVNAQEKEHEEGKKTSFNIAANVGVPTTSGYKIAYGADAQVDIGISEYGAVTVSAGYENISTKAYNVGSITIPESNFGIVPLLAGFKYAFSGSKFYAHAQLGYAFGTSSGSNGMFAYAPSIGYYLSKDFDASIKYLGLSNNGSIGNVLLRLAYAFGK